MKKKFLFILFLFLLNYLVISCERTNQEVSPFTGNSSLKVCTDNKIANEFVVKWKNGKVSLVKNMAQHYFVNDFITQNNDQIEKAEPNYKLTLKPQKLNLSESCRFAGWHKKNIQVDKFWNKNQFGKNIVIAVTDSGIDLENQNLKNSIAFNFAESGIDENGKDKKTNGIDDDGNGYVDDYLGIDLIDGDSSPNDEYGHGTAVSSVITGTENSLAPQAKIIPIKFIDEFNGSTMSAIAAIEYAISRKADIINASWGGGDCSEILPEYLKSIEKQKVLLVVASGNNGKNLDNFENNPPTQPASTNLKNQITVGAIKPISLKRASFSNYGINSVELFAPGGQIEAEDLDNKTTCFDGTSFAAPIVSGSLALLMSSFPDKNQLEIKKLLLDNALRDIDFKNLTEGTLSFSELDIPRSSD